jgi:hypothetical protein
VLAGLRRLRRRRGQSRPCAPHRRGDRSADVPTSPRGVLTTLYGQPPFELPPGFEDKLVDGMLQMATGDDFYPGDAIA